MSDRPELNVNPEIVCNIIAHAREFQAKEGVVIPEETNELSEDFDYLQVLADHTNDLNFQELKAFINDLEPDQQMTLVALMYLGREDYNIDEWEECLAVAHDGWTNHTAEYLLSRPQVAEFLTAGLAEFGYDCESTL